MHGSSSINSLENVLDLANRIKLEGDYKNFSKLAPPPPTILAAFELGDVVGLMDVLEWDGILTRLQAGDQQTREFLQIPHVLHALIYFSIIQKNFPASSQNNDGVMSSENLVTHDLKTKQITVACKLLCQEHSFLTPAIRKDYQELFQILWNFVKIGSVNLDNYSNNNFRTTCWARILQSLLLKLPRELCETFLSQDCDDQFIIDLIHLVTQNPPASDAVVKLFSTLGESNQLADWLRRTNFVNKLLLTGGQKIHVKLAPVIDKELQINLATTSIIFENFSVEHSVHYDDHEMAPRKSNIVTCTDPVNSNDNLGFENRTMISVDTFINSLLHHYHQNKSTLSDLFSCILEEFAQFLPCFTVRQGVPSCSDSSSLRISILIDIISNISLSTIRNLKSKDNQYILPMDLAAPLIDMASKIIVPHIDRLCLLLKCDKNHQSSLGIDRLRIAQLITALASLHEQNITNELIRCNVASILLEKMFIHKSNSLLHICIVQFFKNSLVPHLNLEDCKADSVINKEYSLSPMNILAEDILLRTNVTNRVVEMQRFSQSVE